MATEHYTYRTMWSDEDGEYVGLCDEFPSLSWMAQTPEESLSGIKQLVAGCVADMEMSNELLPKPMGGTN